jgi:SAM-dependent methyltransferase
MGEIRGRSATPPDSPRRMLRVLESPARYRRPAEDIRAMFRRDATLDAYEAAYRRIAPGRRVSTSAGLSERILPRAHLREMPFHRVIMRSIEARILAGRGAAAARARRRLRRRALRLRPLPGGRRRGASTPASPTWPRPPVAASTVSASAADSGDMPFPDAAFASVVSNCVFEHIPEIERTVSEIARVVRPGGVFACTVIGEKFSELLTDARAWRRLGLGRAHRAYLDWFNRKSVHFHFDSPETWRRRLEGAGFEVERWRYYVSPQAAKVFHRAHYVSLPHLAAKRLTGRWVAVPRADGQRLLGAPVPALRRRACSRRRIVHRLRVPAPDVIVL